MVKNPSRQLLDDRVMRLSVIIPVKNEELHLATTLPLISQYVPTRHMGRLIVIDNGSTDGSVAIAKRFDASVITAPDASLGKMRNLGAQEASDDILLFLDADISLTAAWANTLPQVLNTLSANPLTITGSWPEVPTDAGWIARAWTPKRPKTGRVPHLGAAHLLVRTDTFRRIGGFDERISTGEDYDFCVRARAFGAEVVAVPDLRVVHRGEPRTLWQFLRRELWHGTGDFTSVRTIVRSYVAIAATVFVSLHGIMAMSLIMNRVWAPFTFALSLAGVLTLNTLGALHKTTGHSVKSFVQTFLLVWVYLWARFLSGPLALLPGLQRFLRRA